MGYWGGREKRKGTGIKVAPKTVANKLKLERQNPWTQPLKERSLDKHGAYRWVREMLCSRKRLQGKEVTHKQDFRSVVFNSRIRD